MEGLTGRELYYAGSTLPEPLVLLLLVGSGDSGAAVVAGANHEQDVYVLEEGDLGSWRAKHPTLTRTDVSPSDSRRLVEWSPPGESSLSGRTI